MQTHREPLTAAVGTAASLSYKRFERLNRTPPRARTAYRTRIHPS